MQRELIDWYNQSLSTGGYPLIVLLMAMESSIIPLPSELIIIPAAYLAFSQGHLTLPGIVVAGAFGSWLGATAMYGASRLAGRPLVIRYGRFFFISPKKVEQAEQWSSHFGSMGIFISRLLPVVRHLIGIPAGIVRMSYLKFSLYTVLGATLWCSVLSYVGVKAGQNEALMRGDVKQVTLFLGGGVLLLGAIYYFFVYRFATRRVIPASSED